jgi:hypothetical protein
LRYPQIGTEEEFPVLEIIDQYGHAVILLLKKIPFVLLLLLPIAQRVQVATQFL